MHTYTLRLMVGVVVGLVWLWFAGPRRGFERQQLSGLVWAVAGGALFLGRVGYVLSQRAYFLHHPWDMFRLWEIGGWHGSGAWLGGIVAAWIWSRAAGRSLAPVLSLLAPSALLVVAGAWYGCADAGCAWGREMLAPHPLLRWAVVEGPDLYRTVMPRYAVRIAGAVWAVVTAGLAVGLGKRSLWAVSLYAAGAAGLSFLRADPVLMLGPYRCDLILNAALALLTAGLQMRDSRFL